MFKRYLFIISILLAGKAEAQLDMTKGHDNSKPVEITSDSLEVLQNQNKAIFSGDVEAKQGDMDLIGDKMTVFYKKDAPHAKGEKKKVDPDGKDNKISKVEIEKNVFISTEKETAQGDHGVYDVDEGIVTLDGNVTLTSGKNIVKGHKMVYNLKTGQSQMVSGGQPVGQTVTKTGKKERVRAVFIPGTQKQ